MNEIFDYPAYGDRKHPVTVRVSCYQEPPNLYVGLVCAGEDDCGEPYDDITANFDLTMPPYCAAIRNYSSGENNVDFLLDNGFGELTGQAIQSGYATLPVFLFCKEKLRVLDPSGCERYEKSSGHHKDDAKNSREEI